MTQGSARENRDENLEILSKRCDEMGALFQQITSYAERMDRPSQKDAALVREAYERLITNLTAKGQEMVNHAFLLIQESNRDLASAKKSAIALVIVATLIAIGVSSGSRFFSPEGFSPTPRHLQKGTEIVAGGNLDYRVEIQSDDEIGRLAQAFNEMTRRLNESEKERESYIKKLAQSNRELEDFAFIASHDLQEPLRKIQTFGDRVKAKWGDGLGEGGRDYLTRMQNAAMRMQALIQGLLNYSRVTRRPEPFSPVALTPLVQEVVSDLAVRIEQTGGRVEVGDMPVIESSPQQMRQLFQNLLGNSPEISGAKRNPSSRVSANQVHNPPWKKG